MGAIGPITVFAVGFLGGAFVMACLTLGANWLAMPSKTFQWRAGYQQALKDTAAHIDTLKEAV